MLLDVFDSVVGVINDLGSQLGLSWIAVIAFSLLLVTLIISFFSTVFSLEIKTVRAVEKLNAYLESNPFINDENLVEFNKLMKKVPAPMRAQWQQYMVNRDKKPSEFFSEHNCIEKPFKASGYQNHIIAVRTVIICLAILSFVFSCGALSGVAGLSLANIISQSLLLPLIIVFIGVIYTLFLKARRNGAISDLYMIFMNFQHALDRAVTTLPDYVDYEILFTRKEIVSGIPVLQQYLQQRALFEQEQIRKAKESQVEHQEYDFSALGINGSLVMERSMRECEYFLGNRKRILAEISELEGSRDLLEKSYDEKNKTNQRKLRDIQESLDRLKEKLDSTTNIIVGNDLRKQRENEIQKQRQLEKEVDEDNNKYEADKKKIEQQIADKKAEIEGFRKSAESALNGEFQTYADKIYAEIKAVVDGNVKEEIDALRQDNHSMQLALEERDKALTEKTVMYDEKLQVIEDYANKIAEQEQIIADTESLRAEYFENMNNIDATLQSKDKEIFDIKRELESRNIELEKSRASIENYKQQVKDLKRKKQVEVYRYFDANGDEFFLDEDGRPYYADEQGNKLYADGGEQNAEPYAVNEENAQVLEQEQPVEVADADFADLYNLTSEPTNIEADDASVNADENNQVEQAQQDVVNEETVDAQVEEEQIIEEPIEEITDIEEFEENLEELLAENVFAEEHNKNYLSDEASKQLEELNKQQAKEEKTKAEKAKQNKKANYEPQVDFTWENSNAPYEQNDVKEVAPEIVENEVKQPAEPDSVEQKLQEQESIEQIEKEIENQNAELEQQHKNLSNQLEETKAIAEEPVKQEKKVVKKSPAKKSTAKKSTSKTKKPASKSASAKKPTSTATKKVAKSKSEKPATKAKSVKSKTANKSNSAGKAKPKSTKAKSVNKKANAGDGSDITVGDLSLMQFNEQLKSVLQEFNNPNNGEK